jgi:hypothetical protein
MSCLLLVFSGALHNAAKVWDVGSTAYTWNVWRIFWVGTAIVKTTYCFYWDVVHDFGLWKPGYKNLLRDPATLHFPDWVYYTAVLLDFCGRLTWTLAISPQVLSKRWGLLLSIVEISRRGLWNIMRVEYRQEQISHEAAKLMGHAPVEMELKSDQELKAELRESLLKTDEA